MEISYRSLIIGGGGGGRNRDWGIYIIPPFILCWRRLISPPPPTENCANRFPRGGGLLPSDRTGNRLMCRLIESHVHRWIDYNGGEFSLELLVRPSSCIFEILG